MKPPATLFSAVHSPRLLLASAALVCLCSCGTAAYRGTMRGYSRAYAQGNDELMLQNLARLANHQPAHWMQMGAVTASMNFERGLTSSTSRAERSFSLGSALGLTLKADERPTFNFVPLTGKEFADRMMAPISPRVFFTLFEEGWPVDLLMRLLIERIDLGDSYRSHGTLTNQPGNFSTAYLEFLQVCEAARLLQQERQLVLDISSEFSPLAEGHAVAAAPSSEDLMKAREKGLVWQKSGTGWVLGEMRERAVFRLRHGMLSAAGRNNVFSKPGLGTAAARLLVGDFFNMLESGLRLKAPDSQERSGGDGTQARLVLRSLGGVMAAAAREQEDFERILREHGGEFLERTPECQREPVLRLVWQDVPRAELLKASVRLTHAGREYMVTDRKMTDRQMCEAGSRNRDVFRLLMGLYHLVSADMEKLKFPQTLLIQ
ncbi:MAG TPA: hypothetical protein PK490_18190 [Prosthecobacter sp.]|nr:hypothetical protein [Prosthecobacter sp.]HRK16218.1 hypothetical protein [Prosthecobacter sp.]